MLQYKLYLFGPPRLESENQAVSVSPRKALALLVYLAVSRQPHSRDALATLFWPESDQQAARASLRRTLYQLNQGVGQELIEVDQETIVLAGADLWLDTEVFEQGVQAVLAVPVEEMRAGEVEQLRAASALYTDDFLSGFTLPDCYEFDDWQFFQREALRRLLADCLERLMVVQESWQQYDQAIDAARRWLALDVLDEPVHRHLMRLYALAGQQAAALRQYQECVRILEEELGVEPDEETTRLYEQIRRREIEPQQLSPFDVLATAGVPDLSAPAVAPAPLSGLTHNLPANLSPSVGREVELAQLHNLLANPGCRLISIVGLGGIGKTHLALELARQLADAQAPSFPDGLFFVPLAEIEAGMYGSGLTTAFVLADVLGLSLAGGSDPMAQIVAHLRSKQMLLILDNAEQLLDASHPAIQAAFLDQIAAILADATGVKLLITSREPLYLQAEWRLDLESLPYPAADGASGAEGLDPDTLLTYPAVQLLVQSLQQVQSGFRLTPANAPHVHRLTYLLSGIPLALKLAAAWGHVLSCQRIADEIEQSLDILANRLRNLPPRQRSMRAIFDYTWRLLSPEERRIFQALAVFRDGFSEEAAVQVAGAMPSLLAGLLDRGLLRVEATTLGMRYRLHELIRQYAAEKLAGEPVEEAEVKQRHRRYYFALVRTLDPYLQGREQGKILEQIQAEVRDLRSAWIWTLTQGDLDIAHSLVDHIYRFYWTCCRGHEGLELMAYSIQWLQIVEELRDHPHYRFLLRDLIAKRGLFRYFLGEYEIARADFEIALKMSRDLDLEQEVFNALVMLGTLSRYQTRWQSAEFYHVEALALARQIGYRHGEADVLHELAQLRTYFGEYEEAEAFAQESLTISRELERPDWIAWALETLGFIAFRRGQYERARTYYQESLSVFRDIHHQLGVALGLGGLGLIAWAAEGKLADAQSLLEQSLAICRQLGHRFHTCSRLNLLAQIHNDRNEWAAAERYAAEGLQMAQEMDTPLLIAFHLCGLAEARYRRGDWAASRAALLEATRVADEYGLAPIRRLIQFHQAVLLLKESEERPRSAPEANPHVAQARALLLEVSEDAGWWHVYRQRARRLAAGVAKQAVAAS